MPLTFPPATALAGGATLGAAAAAKLALTGRVTGISGIVGGAAAGSHEPWRVASIAGLAAGALTLSLTTPSAFQALPASYTLTRAALAVTAVGAGSALARGCTSGHGVCGLARGSGRSAAATVTFMATAAVSARVTGVFEAVGLSSAASGKATAVAADPTALTLGVATLAALAVGAAVAAAKRASSPPTHTLDALAETATSAAFAIGLGVSGMLTPVRVAGFFGPASVSGFFWDPSLALVMGAALALAAPAFAWARDTRRALLGGALDLPKSTTIDARLLVGAALFGVGWGGGAVCPGPGAVAAIGAAGARTPYLVWTAAFAAAFVAVRKVI